MSLKLCCQATSALGLILFYTVYVICGIDFLFTYFYLNAECPSSYLWSYILVSLITSTLRINVIKIQEMDNPSLVNYLLCLVLTDTCMAIWGASELFNKSCKPIVSSDLWLYGFVTFIIQVTMVSIFFVLCACTVLIAYHDHNKYKEIISMSTV